MKKFRQSIKPPKDLTNPLQYIEDALESKREDLNTKFMKDFIKVVDKQISMLNNKKNEQNSKIIDIQIQNLKKNLMNLWQVLKPKYVDVFQNIRTFVLIMKILCQLKRLEKSKKSEFNKNQVSM